LEIQCQLCCSRSLIGCDRVGIESPIQDILCDFMHIIL
jgi:hypothetical protein